MHKPAGAIIPNASHTIYSNKRIEALARARFSTYNTFYEDKTDSSTWCERISQLSARHSLSLSLFRQCALLLMLALCVCVCVLCTIIEHNLCMYLCDAVARAIKRMFVACILLRHFSIYIYDIDVTRYYLNSYLSCSFSAFGIPFSIDICVPRTHFD